MRAHWPVHLVALAMLALACSDSKNAPAAPTGVTAVAGDGQVTVSWTASSGASSYTLYYSITSGSGKSGTAVPGITGTTKTVTGLTNGTRYFFVVTASADSDEQSGISGEVSATPGVPLAQSDLAGMWRFSVLSAGASPGWQRGTLTVGTDGIVSFSSYSESASMTTTAPASFLPMLLVDASGHLRDASSMGTARFTGDLGLTHKNMIIATASAGGTRSLAILQKHEATTTFATNSDLLGFGNAGGGARKFVYNQLASGPLDQEWEFVGLQIGQMAAQPQYTASMVLLPYLDGLTSPMRPTDRITSMDISTDGIVTETLLPAMGTPPNFVVASGFMSDDKSVIVAVGTATDGRFMMRIYQVMNTVASDPTTSSQPDLAGTYSFRKLVVGGAALSASGNLAIDAAGTTTYSSYSDSNNSMATPGQFTLAVGSLDPLLAGGAALAGYYGILSNSSDATLHGKLSHEKDLFVFTKTETAGNPGAYSITLGVK